MACCHKICFVLIGHLEKLVKFDLPVAEYIRIGSPACLVFSKHVIHHTLFIFFTEVCTVERNIQFSCHQLCEDQVVFPGAVAFQGACFIVPVDHKYSNYIITFLFKEICCNA